MADRWDSHGHYVDRLTGGVVWYMPAVALSIQALVGPALMHPGLGDVSSLNANPHALCYGVRRVGRRRRELQVDITGADNPTEQRTKSEES